MVARRPLVAVSGRPQELPSGDTLIGGVAPQGKLVWVDSVYGSDSTGLRERADFPFLTLRAAMLAASSGDTVAVRPGSYSHTSDTSLYKAGVSWWFMDGAAVANNAASGDGYSLFDVPTTGLLRVTGGIFTGKRFIYDRGQAIIAVTSIACSDTTGSALFIPGADTDYLSIACNSISNSSGIIVDCRGSVNGRCLIDAILCTPSNDSYYGIDHQGAVLTLRIGRLTGKNPIRCRSNYYECNVSVTRLVSDGTYAGITVEGNGVVNTNIVYGYSATAPLFRCTSGAYNLRVVATKLESAYQVGLFGGGSVFIACPEVICTSTSKYALESDGAATVRISGAYMWGQYGGIYALGGAFWDVDSCKIESAGAGSAIYQYTGAGQVRLEACIIYSSTAIAVRQATGTMLIRDSSVAGGANHGVEHTAGTLTCEYAKLKGSGSGSVGVKGAASLTGDFRYCQFTGVTYCADAPSYNYSMKIARCISNVYPSGNAVTSIDSLLVDSSFT
jgi:hypothetical protein